jgi:tellurite resistance protein
LGSLNPEKNFKILKEELHYQSIYCVKIFCKHILTNTIHELALIDIFRKPKIHIENAPEEFSNLDIKNTFKTGLKFFGKLFKTKTYIQKTDKFKKIKLLIYLAKADDKVEETEKEFIIQFIQSISEFTNLEKQELFNMLSAKNLPELIDEDFKFSSRSVVQEIIEQLEKLSLSDNNISEKEQIIIEKLKNK